LKRSEGLRGTHSFGSMGAALMNSASQDFPHHLSVLRERMLHPTTCETAVSYLLEEFAGDTAFVRASDPHLTN
jgi:hypothetical protein